jgi:hypothetical protein
VVPGTQVRVHDRGPGIGAHAAAAHGVVVALADHDPFGAGGLEDRGAEAVHLGSHGVLVLAVGERHQRTKDAVLVGLIGELDAVLRIRQALSLGAQHQVVRVGGELVGELLAPPA